jgi:signal transduction histidine kinase
VNEAQRAARTGSVVIAGSNAQDGDSMARISAPIVVQGQSVAVFQALVPSVNEEATGQPPVLSLAVVCQELGNWVERALLRNAAQRGVVLEEKNRIARELHDTVLQILFSLGLGVDWCMHRVGDDGALGGKLQEMRKLTASASSELRSAIFTVTSRVAEVGLMPALQTLATDFLQQYSLPVSLSSSGQQPEIALLSQNALHRVVRESLMNVYKHAQATHISVRLIFEADSIAVVVQDDGIGLPEHIIQHLGDDPAHFGLRTIARQIEDLGGSFEILNGEESGAIVRASVPAKRLAKEASHDHASAY